MRHIHHLLPTSFKIHTLFSLLQQFHSYFFRFTHFFFLFFLQFSYTFECENSHKIQTAFSVRYFIASTSSHEKLFQLHCATPYSLNSHFLFNILLIHFNFYAIFIFRSWRKIIFMSSSSCFFWCYTLILFNFFSNVAAFFWRTSMDGDSNEANDYG